MCLIRFSVFWLLLLPGLPSLASSIDFSESKVVHIKFSRIPPNQYEYKKDMFSVQVNKSASFLLIPFTETKTISSVSFQWKSKGHLKVKDEKQEKTRKGDDAYLRVGLILRGNRQPVNPLAPAWVKKVNEILLYPSGNMLYLVPGARHPHGKRWKSPYSNDVEILSVKSKQLSDGWNLVVNKLERSYRVIGLWLMADGDNTGSKFTSQLKMLRLD